MNESKNLELVLVEQEPEKDKLEESNITYQILNNKCDIILTKIKTRKQTKKAV